MNGWDAGIRTPINVLQRHGVLPLDDLQSGVPSRLVTPKLMPRERLGLPRRSSQLRGAEAGETLIIHARLTAMLTATLQLATLIGALLVLITATPASAQSGVYVSGAAFADVREFGSYDSNGPDRCFGRLTTRPPALAGRFAWSPGSIRDGRSSSVSTASTTSVRNDRRNIIQIFPPPLPDSSISRRRRSSHRQALWWGTIRRNETGAAWISRRGFAFVRAATRTTTWIQPSLTIGSDFSFGIEGVDRRKSQEGCPSVLPVAKREIRPEHGAVVL